MSLFLKIIQIKTHILEKEKQKNKTKQKTETNKQKKIASASRFVCRENIMKGLNSFG